MENTEQKYVTVLSNFLYILPFLLQEDVKQLAQPLTLNCVHVDSQNFLFGCLEVNSLDIGIDGAQPKNLFWVTKMMPLFQKCEYVDAEPIIEGYNPEVIETFMAMHRSQLSV